MNVAVILAGGSGDRLKSSRQKQLVKLAGKAVIEHTLNIFQKSKVIDEIAIIANDACLDEIEKIVSNSCIDKVKRILLGGKTRNESSLAAINSYMTDDKVKDINLIFHDAVRPFLSQEILRKVVEALDSYNAVDVAIPATDTIIESISGNIITNIPERSKLFRGQTPQAFRLETIKNAYDIALKDKGFKATDDCGVVIKYLPNEKVFIVNGSEMNMKITYELDLFIADKLFQLNSFQINHEKEYYFNLLKDKTVVVFGGSYGIGKDIVDICKKYTKNVFSFSRSENGVDVKETESVKKSLKSVYQKCGRIDYVVNTAALLKKETLVNTTYGDIQDVIDTNYKGMVNVAKEAFDYLKDSHGQILFFTSSSYSKGRAFYSLYSSTKASAVNFTQALSEEWSDFSIRVNCINPERTKTPMRIKNFGNEPDANLLKSEDVALVAIKTLISDFTGQVVYIRKEDFIE